MVSGRVWEILYGILHRPSAQAIINLAENCNLTEGIFPKVKVLVYTFTSSFH